MIRRGLILLVGATTVLGLPAVLRADPMSDKLVASAYNVKLVPAFDECASPVTVVGGEPACDPTHSSTDGTPFNMGKLIVKHKPSPAQVLGILKSSAVGKTLAGKNVAIRLVLRVTKSKGEPLVTWEDQTLTCPASTVPSTGNVILKHKLADCGLATQLVGTSTYKEVVSAAIIDQDSGKPIAVPGVRDKI